MRRIRTDRLKTIPLLAGLFPIRPSDRETVAVSMRERGYDPAEPIVVWKGRDLVVDGHTRLAAAREADIEQVCIDERDFEGLRGALEYAIRRQRDRRNLTGKELDGFVARAIEALDSLKPRGGDHGNQHTGGKEAKASPGAFAKSAAATAEQVGVSARTVERARAVLASGDEATRAALLQGRATANGAYRAVKHATAARRDSAPPSPSGPIPLPILGQPARIASADDGPPQSGPIRSVYSVPDWESMAPEVRAAILNGAPATEEGAKAHFNAVNENIDWARWSWNPVTGCEHDCDYCYARDIAVRYYEQGFEPTFLPSRLAAPSRTRIPERTWKNLILPMAEHRGPCREATDAELWEVAQWKNVFVCSMADLFGKWVPQEWIDAVFGEIRANPQWNFLCLTKFPQRMSTLAWPDNAWCGTTVDRQARVGTAERSFRNVRAGVRWLSCEPLLERLTFSDLSMFDWVVIGASSKSTRTPEFQPPWEWVEHLMAQARAAGCAVYIKPNLKSRPKEFPSVPTEAP